MKKNLLLMFLAIFFAACSKKDNTVTHTFDRTRIENAAFFHGENGFTAWLVANVNSGKLQAYTLGEGGVATPLTKEDFAQKSLIQTGDGAAPYSAMPFDLALEVTFVSMPTGEKKMSPHFGLAIPARTNPAGLQTTIGSFNYDEVAKLLAADKKPWYHWANHAVSSDFVSAIKNGWYAANDFSLTDETGVPQDFAPGADGAPVDAAGKAAPATIPAEHWGFKPSEAGLPTASAVYRKYTVTRGIVLTDPKNAALYDPANTLVAMLIEGVQNNGIVAYTKSNSGNIASPEGVSVAVPMLLKDFNENMIVPKTSQEDTSPFSMFAAKDLTRLNILEEASVSGDGKITFRVLAVGMAIPGELYPTGLEKELGWFSLADFKSFFDKAGKTAYTEAITARQFGGDDSFYIGSASGEMLDALKEGGVWKMDPSAENPDKFLLSDGQLIYKALTEAPAL